MIRLLKFCCERLKEDHEYKNLVTFNTSEYDYCDDVKYCKYCGSRLVKGDV